MKDVRVNLCKFLEGEDLAQELESALWKNFLSYDDVDTLLSFILQSDWNIMKWNEQKRLEYFFPTSLFTGIEKSYVDF